MPPVDRRRDPVVDFDLDPEADFGAFRFEDVLRVEPREREDDPDTGRTPIVVQATAGREAAIITLPSQAAKRPRQPSPTELVRPA